MKLNFLTKSLVVILILFLGILVASPRQDPDMWWHIRLGQEFVENGNLQNASTFTCKDETWINYSIASDVIIYLIYKVAGLAGIYFLSYLVLMLGIYLTYKLIQKLIGQKIDPVLSIFYFVSSIVFLNIFSAVRPQLFSYLYVVVLIYMLFPKASPRFSKFEWVKLLIISVVFINLHSAFVSGYLVILIFLLKNVIQSALKTIEHTTRENFLGLLSLILHYLAVGISLLLITGLNYWGFDVWGEIMRGLSTEHIASINEWKDIDFNNLNYFIYFLMIATIIFFRNHLKNHQSLLIYLIPFSLMSFLSIRNIFYNIPILLTLFFVMAHYLKSNLGKDVIEILSSKVFKRLLILYFALIFSLLIIETISRIEIFISMNQNQEKIENKNEYPVRALSIIKTQLSDKNFFNNYGWGGYLSYKAPEQKWFIDGRMTAWQCDGNFIDSEIMSDYFEIENLGSKWKQTMDHWNINAVLIKPNSDLAVLLGELPEWQLAYKDSVAVVFIRN